MVDKKNNLIMNIQKEFLFYSELNFFVENRGCGFFFYYKIENLKIKKLKLGENFSN
jgi:hypothetical protein